jgi:hypothetical protein
MQRSRDFHIEKLIAETSFFELGLLGLWFGVSAKIITEMNVKRYVLREEGINDWEIKN